MERGACSVVITNPQKFCFGVVGFLLEFAISIPMTISGSDRIRSPDLQGSKYISGGATSTTDLRWWDFGGWVGHGVGGSYGLTRIASCQETTTGKSQANLITTTILTTVSVAFTKPSELPSFRPEPLFSCSCQSRVTVKGAHKPRIWY